MHARVVILGVGKGVLSRGVLIPISVHCIFDCILQVSQNLWYMFFSIYVFVVLTDRRLV